MTGAPTEADDDRSDLAAMLVPLGRALTAGEQPILEARALTMWAYMVLVRLGDEPMRTQAALADTIRADRTRIIPVLDDLQARGFIRREPDPADRRSHLLSLTSEGRTIRDRVRADIRAYEHRLLDHLNPADQRAFVRALTHLSALPWEELTAPGADD